MATDPTRRDLITLLLACLAGLSVGGAAAADAPVDDDLDLDPVFFRGCATLFAPYRGRTEERNMAVELMFKPDGAAVLWILKHDGYRFDDPDSDNGINLPVDVGLELRSALGVVS